MTTDNTWADREFPDTDTLRAALELACRAPSVHNSQPWSWRLGESTVHLFADWTRHLPATDPDGRDLLVSCGAVLHHARVAFAAFGWHATVHRLPDPADPDHLAAIEFARADASPSDLMLAAAILRRRSDRRAYSASPIPPEQLVALTKAAGGCGTVLTTASSPAVRAPLVEAITRANAAQSRNPGYAHEIFLWSGTHTRSPDGVPAANSVTAAGYGDLALRQFATPSIEVADRPSGAGVLLVVGTSSDDTLSRLLAGEATSAVLLAATAARLSSCPLSQPLEVEETRDLVRDEVIGGAMVPQMVLRVGRPRPRDRALPATGRRTLDDVLAALPARI
ncbi:Nitroreductase family protein [Actinokineospora alba]|uniref:Nitroreductase family protein n=1 Tax=Actinokineospora alba TaxID=504798 RepID=A0A1H0FNM6_9PSEU|nr:nitroreductase family protein [Actinokineospora alba]TDP69552.1 nitroreductase family protein [Actinokineospora alba]SDI14390.1 Nitroreductase family protein [Actinokineospora alba]SDN96276.1 Nitroreductase family protein [Actinokineospora alba]